MEIKVQAMAYRRMLKSWMVLAGIFLLQVPATAVRAEMPVQVKVARRATVTGDMIRLGDIAAISHPDARRCSVLKGVVIGRAPLAGSSRVLDRGLVRMRLRQHGVDLARIQLEMPFKITVVRAAQTVTAERIREAVRDFFRRRIAPRIGRARLRKVNAGDKVTVPSGLLALHVIPLRPQRLIGNVPLAVEVYVDGRLQKKAFAAVVVESIVDAVVARHMLKRSRLITEADVMLKPLDRSRLPRNFVSDLQEVLGKRTKRRIPAGTVLRPDLVDLPCLIRRRDVVTIIARANGLEISTLGEARQRGRLGDRIRVVNLDSKKNVYGRVMDKNTVAVDF